MDRRFRGIGEELQQWSGDGWYVVPKAGFPRGQTTCSWCVRAARPKQVVFCWSRPCQKIKNLVENPANPNHYFMMHKVCLEDALAMAPLTDYETIRDRIAAGGPLFDE